MGVRGASLVVGMLALLVVLQAPSPVEAEVAACTPDASIDVTADVESSPAVVPNQANGFDRLDIQKICITENATTTLVILTVGATVSSVPLQEYHWFFNYKVGAGGLQFLAYGHTNTSPSSTPAGAAESSGARIQFAVAKTTVPVGARLNGMFFNSTGQFIDQNGDTITGKDRGPNAGASTMVYVVGTNSPAGTDTDNDGIEDKVEVQQGSNPGLADSDGDGLKDGEEATLGSDPNRADTDGDGLLDGQEKTFSTDPTASDTDDDGLSDNEEVTGSRNQGYTAKGFIANAGGSTNPTVGDTDGDGIKDGDEVSGRLVTPTGVKPFAPTDPNNPDSDGDGLTDLEELNGLHVTPAGINIRFTPTDPTKADTDSDGSSDFAEVQAQTDPTDKGKHPGGADAADAVVQYLPFSLVLLALVILVSAGGILWRWG